jgi:putative transposase
MIDRKSELSVTRRCQRLSLSRSTAYHRPKDLSADDLAITRHIDKIHIKRPFYRSHRKRDWFVAENHGINRKRVQRLMRLMGIMALPPKKGISRTDKGHKFYPYLLKGLSINLPNQVFLH